MVFLSRLPAATVLCLSLAVAACTSPSTQPRHPVKLATYLNPGFVFRYPARWHRLDTPDWSSSFTTVFGYIGNVPLSDPCTHTVDTLSCAPFPRKPLSRGGVVVSWSANGTPLWTLANSKGTPTRVGQEPARLRTLRGRALGCPRGTTETIQATIARPAAHNWYEMDACLAAPEGAAHDEVLAMLHSIRHIA